MQSNPSINNRLPKASSVKQSWPVQNISHHSKNPLDLMRILFDGTTSEMNTLSLLKWEGIPSSAGKIQVGGRWHISTPKWQ